MAKDSTEDFAHPVVALEDPNGDVVHVSTAIDVTNLVFGSGYKVRDHGGDVNKAYEFLAKVKDRVEQNPQTVQETVAANAAEPKAGGKGN
jgi:hypothetical protein